MRLLRLVRRNTDPRSRLERRAKGYEGCTIGRAARRARVYALEFGRVADVAEIDLVLRERDRLRRGDLRARLLGAALY